MNIFLSYANENSGIAEEIYFALVGSDHQVFFDKPSLMPADNYDQRLREAVEAADGLVFLISPSSVQAGRYTLTELKYARHKWPHPKNRVLPVIVQPTDIESIPAYLKAVTLLEPEGNIAAEVTEAVNNLVTHPPNARIKPTKDDKRQGILQQNGALFTVVLSSIVISVGLGTLFSFTYPTVPITLSLASLFVMASLLIVFTARRILKKISQIRNKRVLK
ncbi:MAG: toll/interleukin-1 receptor domain-containing protein [Methylococcaceae bacterium]|nr:toll/interleukin-1 receptor domain-containing protein [Methylococcaceae bacterium]